MRTGAAEPTPKARVIKVGDRVSVYPAERSMAVMVSFDDKPVPGIQDLQLLNAKVDEVLVEQSITVSESADAPSDFLDYMKGQGFVVIVT